MNQLAVTSVIPMERMSEADVLFAGALASQEANQDPIDLAILAAAKERHVFDGRSGITPVWFAPFDAKNRRTEAVVLQDGKKLRVIKGAVETVWHKRAALTPRRAGCWKHGPVNRRSKGTDAGDGARI